MHEFYCDHVVTYKITFDTHEELKKWKEEEISAFLVYFPEEDYEYTIPYGCLELFSKED